MSRTRALLPVLLAVVAACGSGTEEMEEAAAPRLAPGDAVHVQLLEDGGVRWVSAGRPEGAVEELPDPEDHRTTLERSPLQRAVEAMPRDGTWRLRLATAAPWSRVERVLRVVRVHGGVVFDGTGHEHLVHREPAAADGIRVLVDLEGGAEGRRELRLEASGHAWVRRVGCNETGGTRVGVWPGWDGAALEPLAATLREILAVLDGDASRLLVRVQASAETATAGDVLGVWSKVLGCGARHVALGRRARGHRNAIQEALRWLHAHRSPDGRWEAAGFDRWCGGEPMPPADLGVGERGYDVQATSLALFAFVGARYVDRGKFGRGFARALAWLRGRQDKDGFIGDRDAGEAADGHALATLVLTAAYRLGARRQEQRAAVEAALGHLPRILSGAAGRDLRTTGWVLLAWAWAREEKEDQGGHDGEAPLALPEDLEMNLRAAMVDLPGLHGRRGEALALFGRIVLGEDPRRNDAIQALTASLVARPPRASTLDPWTVFFATHGLFQVGGKSWKRWSEHLRAAVSDTWVPRGSPCCSRGSWPAQGPDTALGGRLATTALLCLALEVHFAHASVLQPR